MAEEKKRGTFWFVADTLTFDAVFRAELEKRLKIMEGVLLDLVWSGAPAWLTSELPGATIRAVMATAAAFVA